MPCFFVLGALIIPRVSIVYLWLMTNWFSGVFDSLLWPILGFFFAPTSLLWYSVVIAIYNGEWGTFQIIVMILAVLTDISPTSGKKRKSKSN